MSATLLAVLTIVGTWQYAGFRYNGDLYPNPNPNLVLLFTFNADGTSHLIWSRKNEAGFCERRGEYRLDADVLWQKTTWLNPANDRSCASDPDMQPGRETRTPILLSAEELAFILYLDGREFHYLLRPVPGALTFQSGQTVSSF